MNILLIEDDPLIGRMYEKVFGFEGYQITWCKDGEEGLEKAKVEKPSLILLDIMLPNIDGLEVLKRLKEASETKTTPVVMLTNIASNQSLETALQRGALLYVVKSEHDPKEVVEIVRKVLAGEKPQIHS